MHDKTTIIFDFFGTLVEYTPGSYLKNKRRDTYTKLVLKGFSSDYETFAASVQSSYEMFRIKALETEDEFPMTSVIQEVLQQGFYKDIEPTIVEEVTTLFLNEWMKDVNMLPNIHHFLENLSQHYTLGIISNTNSPTLIPTILDRFKMDHYFSHITTSIEHGKRKPHPAIFQDTLTIMNLQPSMAMYIGDNYNSDYLGAKKIGLQTFLIDPDNNYPHLGKERIKSLFDLENQL